MKAKYILLLIIFVALLSVSCKKDKNKFQCVDGSSNFSHLAVGHELKYIYYSPTSTDDTMIISNLSTDSFGTYKCNITLEPSHSMSDVYYHACGKELYTSSNGNLEQYKNYWLSLDQNTNDTWTRSFNDKIYSYKLYAKNATITTPILNTTFTDCYKFTFKTGNVLYDADTIYFKPDIGIIYYQGISSTYELASKNF